MEASRALNSLRGGAILMAGSGMCDAGRIKHHLKHNLWRKECSVIIVGFQAQGPSAGRSSTAAKRVRVFGEEIAVAADVYTIGGCRRARRPGRPPRVGGAIPGPPGKRLRGPRRGGRLPRIRRDAEREARVQAQSPRPASRWSSDPTDDAFRPSRVLLCVLLLLLPATAGAADPQDAILREVGVDEKPGAAIPRDLPFTDASGSRSGWRIISATARSSSPSTTTPARCSAP